MLLNCSCTTSIDKSLFEFTKRPWRSKPDAHSHLLVWTYRERRVGLSGSHDRVASNNANSLLQVRNALWVFQGERRRVTKSIRARVRPRENHMKPFVRTSFLGTRPSCLPSPGRPFFAADDRKPILWLGRTGSPVKSILRFIWRIFFFNLVSRSEKRKA